MEENLDVVSHPQEKKQRPEVLTVFLFVTFITRVMGVLQGVLLLFLGEKMLEFVAKQFPDVAKELAPVFTNKLLISVGIVASIVQFAGALYMWKLKKLGFHMYMVGKLVQFIVPYLILGFAASNVLDIFFGLIFWIIWPIVYFVHLKYMD